MWRRLRARHSPWNFRPSGFSWPFGQVATIQPSSTAEVDVRAGVDRRRVEHGVVIVFIPAGFFCWSECGARLLLREWSGRVVDTTITRTSWPGVRIVLPYSHARRLFARMNSRGFHMNSLRRLTIRVDSTRLADQRRFRGVTRFCDRRDHPHQHHSCRALIAKRFNRIRTGLFLRLM